MLRSILQDIKIVGTVFAAEAVVLFSLFVIANVIDEFWFNLGYYFQFGLTVAILALPILWFKRRKRL